LKNAIFFSEIRFSHIPSFLFVFFLRFLAVVYVSFILDLTLSPLDLSCAPFVHTSKDCDTWSFSQFNQENEGFRWANNWGFKAYQTRRIWRTKAIKITFFNFSPDKIFLAGWKPCCSFFYVVSLF
jgi:hypothetical protein